LATGETKTIRADGTYKSQFATISGANRMRQHDVGRYTIEDDSLVLGQESPGQQEARQRITGGGRSADGRGAFLLLGVTRDGFTFTSAPRHAKHRLRVAINQRVASSARRGLAFRSWNSASCLRRKRFSAARVRWERTASKAN
jgi:hypothetical protein